MATELSFSKERIANPVQNPEQWEAVVELREQLMKDDCITGHEHAEILLKELQWQASHSQEEIRDAESKVKTFLDCEGLSEDATVDISTLAKTHRLRRFLSSSCLVRYLRARDYNVQKVYAMWSSLSSLRVGFEAYHRNSDMASIAGSSV